MLAIGYNDYLKVGMLQEWGTRNEKRGAAFAQSQKPKVMMLKAAVPANMYRNMDWLTTRKHQWFSGINPSMPARLEAL